jgi:hypothetical protein
MFNTNIRIYFKKRSNSEYCKISDAFLPDKLRNSL